MHSKATKCVTDNFFVSMSTMSLPKDKFGILLAFSGGADSCALLSLLHEYREKFNYTLCALHVNHMIRGLEADRDENFCRERCDELKVPFYLHKADVPALAKELKSGIEETAREVRYGVLEETAAKLHNDTGLKFYIATAHNADDNVETILFNLTRGSSLSGICGIKAMRENIIRPLLLSSKSEIFGYCEENGVKYITDSTNADTTYTRNKLRNKVVPVLREINPALTTSVSRLSASLSYDNDYLTSVSDNFIAANVSDNSVSLKALSELHPSIRSRVIYSLLKDIGARETYEIHLDSIFKLCDCAVPHTSLDLPSGITAHIESGKLVLRKGYTPGAAPEFYLPFEYGINKIPDSGDVIARFEGDDKDNIEKFKNIYKKFIQTDITSATIKGALSLRSRKPGDTFNINGVNRKLKKLLWEIEPDIQKRDALPLVCDEDGILWIPGTRSRTGTFPRDNETYQTFFYVDHTVSQ